MKKQQELYLKGYGETHIEIVFHHSDKTTKTHCLCASEVNAIYKMQGMCTDVNNCDVYCNTITDYHGHVLIEYLQGYNGSNITRVNIITKHWHRYYMQWLNSQLCNPKIRNKKKFIKYLLNYLEKDWLKLVNEFITYSHNMKYLNSFNNNHLIDYLKCLLTHY